MCGCPDRITTVEGEFDVRGNKRIEHQVTIELRYIKDRQHCTLNLEAKGWRYRLHQARHAMERFVCRPCLIATQDMAGEFRRKREKELGQKNHDTYYLAVAGE